MAPHEHLKISWRREHVWPKVHPVVTNGMQYLGLVLIAFAIDGMDDDDDR